MFTGGSTEMLIFLNQLPISTSRDRRIDFIEFRPIFSILEVRLSEKYFKEDFNEIGFFF